MKKGPAGTTYHLYSGRRVGEVIVGVEGRRGEFHHSFKIEGRTARFTSTAAAHAAAKAAGLTPSGY